MFSRLCAMLLLALLSTSAHAVIGTIDQVPAATLLFPHFEVDPDDPNGVNTILTVQNSSATAILVNVTLWTDLGLPTTHFNVYLTGYDQQTVDLRSVFSRDTPRTASAGQDPTDTISHKGTFSQDINFASCNNYLNGQQDGSAISRGIVAAHTGAASADYFGGQCGSRDLGDGVARGYVTMDTINSCTNLTPASLDYIDNVITFQNVMFGNYSILDPGAGLHISDAAVPIEASFNDPLVQPGPNKQTFYGRLLGNGAQDRREPLPTAWAGRAAAGRTDVDFWRDPGTTVAPFACGAAPPVPTGQHQLAVQDAGGTTVATPSGNLLPFVSGSASGTSLGITPPLGWLFANLNLAAPSGPLGAVRGSWLTFRQVPSGVPVSEGMRYSTQGIQLGNAATGDDPILP